MPYVKVKENEPFDVALRRFKRSCEKAGILAEVRKREFYEKPTSVRKRRAAAAVKRYAKKVQRNLEEWKNCSKPQVSTSIHNRVREDTNLALKQREKGRVAALRLILAEMKRVEVDEQQELSDARALQILDKMTKQRRDSYSQFLEAGRKDLADQEEFEIKVISEYMPTPLTEIEIEQIVLSSLEKLEEPSMKNMGKVMTDIQASVQGRADMKDIATLVKKKLS